MDRRQFLKSATLGPLVLGAGYGATQAKTHILTLSFDDGFKKSHYKTAEIHEQFGLKACLNVIATGHLPSFVSPDPYIVKSILGNFDDWNALRKRGHEVMAHTFDHRNLTKMPLEEAKANITQCAQYFEEHLHGFKAANAVYNFAFNASTPELDQFALTKFRAVRTRGTTWLNPIPTSNTPVRLGCQSHGPENMEKWLDEQLNVFLTGSGGWMIINCHGLDEEGWGPLGSTYLHDLLKRLVKIKTLAIMPTGEVLKKAGK